ncbi:membrane hypothetical protein [[Clostridium] ultunense Esp]|nr:membrane hypothetical protein [[Clostridium] ultunense Esp]
MSLAEQIATLLAVTGTGMGMALTYDWYGWFRRRLHLRGAILAFLDLLYWFLFALLFLFILIRVNGGQFRILLFFLLGFGGIIYFRFFSAPFLQGWDKAAILLLRISRWMEELLFAVWKGVYLLILRPLQVLIRALVSFTLFILMGFGQIFGAFLRKTGKSLYALSLIPVKMILKMFGKSGE